jgi:hypothetical protein
MGMHFWSQNFFTELIYGSLHRAVSKYRRLYSERQIAGTPQFKSEALLVVPNRQRCFKTPCSQHVRLGLPTEFHFLVCSSARMAPADIWPLTVRQYCRCTSLRKTGRQEDIVRYTTGECAAVVLIG